jgi:hypothetical protein
MSPPIRTRANEVCLLKCLQTVKTTEKPAPLPQRIDSPVADEK